MGDGWPPGASRRAQTGIKFFEDSGQMESYGSAGSGQWITLYANAGHVYAKIAGLWCDTGAQSSSNDRDRWSTRRASPAGGFVVRHPTGY
jgi:hypothetical protein